MAKRNYQNRNKNPILFSRQFKDPAAPTNSIQEKSSDSDKWLGLTLVLFLLSGSFIILIALLGEYGVLAFQDLKQNEQHLIERIETLNLKEQKLLREIDALKNNLDYIEALARKELGLIRKDEVIYFLPDNPSFQNP